MIHFITSLHAFTVQSAHFKLQTSFLKQNKSTLNIGKLDSNIKYTAHVRGSDYAGEILLIKRFRTGIVPGVDPLQFNYFSTIYKDFTIALFEKRTLKRRIVKNGIKC